MAQNVFRLDGTVWNGNVTVLCILLYISKYKNNRIKLKDEVLMAMPKVRKEDL